MKWFYIEDVGLPKKSGYYMISLNWYFALVSYFDKELNKFLTENKDAEYPKSKIYAWTKPIKRAKERS